MQIELVTQLLGIAGKGLAGNPGLVPMALGLQLVVGLLEVPLLLASIAALMNGQLAYNPERTDGGKAKAPQQCVGEDGGNVLCCVWETEPWVPAFMTLAGVAMMWTLFVAFEVGGLGGGGMTATHHARLSHERRSTLLHCS